MLHYPQEFHCINQVQNKSSWRLILRHKKSISREGKKWLKPPIHQVTRYFTWGNGSKITFPDCNNWNKRFNAKTAHKQTLELKEIDFFCGKIFVESNVTICQISFAKSNELKEQQMFSWLLVWSRQWISSCK